HAFFAARENNSKAHDDHCAHAPTQRAATALQSPLHYPVQRRYKALHPHSANAPQARAMALPANSADYPNRAEHLLTPALNPALTGNAANHHRIKQYRSAAALTAAEQLVRAWGQSLMA